MGHYLIAGKILRVDLTNQKISEEPTNAYFEQFIGGRGINAKIIYDGVTPELKPLDPDNIITFGAGPLTGTEFPGSSRTDIMAKSPVTNLLGNSNVGGHWSPEVKFAGYDHIVIQGKAEKPVYISINNKNVDIRDAGNLWGKDTWETQSLIKAELGDLDTQVMCIGPAGEKLVCYATIQTCMGDAAGRTGMGAVMGSKNLKAIAVRGTGGIKIADPNKYSELCKEVYNLLKEHPSYQELSQVGATRLTDLFGKINYIPLENFQKYTWDEGKEISCEDFLKKYLYKKVGCFGCPMRCKEFYKVPDGGDVVLSCNFYSDFIWRLKNSDMKLFLEIASLCQNNGIDQISVAGIISWAIEMFEKGVITEKDTEGIPLKWGSRETIIPNQIGKGADKYIMHTKGNPLYGSNIAPFRGSALATAVGSRGDLMRSIPLLELNRVLISAYGFDEATLKMYEEYYDDLAEKITGKRKAAISTEYEGKSALVGYYEDIITINDMLGNCKWISSYLDIPITPEMQANILSAGLGISIEADELFKAAKRIRCLERAFDVREGLTQFDDTLPDRLFEPLPDGKFKGERLDRSKFEKMKEEFYTLRGWDTKTGIPTGQTLEKLGLKEIAEDLSNRGILSSTKKKSKR